MNNSTNPLIQVKESDLNSIRFDFLIRDQGTVVDLTGAEVRLVVKKPSGYTVIQDCVITNALEGACEVILTNQAYLEVGSHTGELVITIGESTITTKSFEYSSLDAILDDRTIKSANDWQVLHDILLGNTTPGTTDPTLTTISWTNVTEKPLTYPPDAHTHPEYLTQTDTDLLYQPIGAPIETSVTWTEIVDRPLTFPPDAHTHPEYLTSTDAALLYQPLGTIPVHSHSWGEVTDKPLTFTPPLMGVEVGGARVGNGLQMAGEYLTVRQGTGIVTTTEDPSLRIDKSVTDTWYAKNEQGLALWRGTQAEYDAIITPDPNTLYFITG